MELLQCSVSFPIIYKGKLIGIFNIDDKITEEAFYLEELEIIYVLCNYLAAAIKDVDLYHQIMYQKEFTKNIVSSMNSGMIVAGKDERINVFNPQASEILNIESAGAIGSHLSSLPSPLGDILLETLLDGTVYNRHEVNVAPDNMPLGINSYRLLDETKNPVGAGIVFTDLSDCRKLEEQSKRTAKLQAVNELMAKIAHEVRNPLTSIQTYTQLLNEKYANDELHEFYISAVTQSIDRLDNLIDKLVTFSTTQEYNLKRESLREIFSEAVHFAYKKLPATHKLVYHSDNDFITINADRKNLIKAFYYLAESIVEMTPDGALINMHSILKEGEFPVVEVVMKSVGIASVIEGKDDLLDPFLDMNHLGSGLNVPLCQKIIEKHGGTLEIRNDNGVSSFVVTLPVLNIFVPGEQKSGR
jgi:nitrogen-specific signal transduction histidine kinase